MVVTGDESGAGTVLVAVCRRDHFLGRDCRHTASAPAVPGRTRVTVAAVPPGVYGVQAIHDADADRALGRNLVGWPTEGLGFSNDAPMNMGPPRFADAAVRIGPRGGIVRFAMRYY